MNAILIMNSTNCTAGGPITCRHDSKWKMVRKQLSVNVSVVLEGVLHLFISSKKLESVGETSHAIEHWRNKRNLSQCGTRLCHFVKELRS